MPGVLIDDMPFALDSVSSPASPFFDQTSAAAAAAFYHHHQQSAASSSSSSSHFDQQHLLETIIASAVSSSAPSSPSSVASSMDSPLHRFLPSNNNDESTWSAEDVYSCDEFRMFEFKVRRCMRGRSHDWTECPFAHPGEKARRRDPRRFHYSGTACPDFRKGSCKNGDACELAHGVFECWLHPARYRTQPCKDGRSCKRRVCFFAHTSEQLRLLSTSSSPSSSLALDLCSTASASPCSSPRRSISSSCSSTSSSLLRSLNESNHKAFEPIESSSPTSSPHCCCSHNHQQQQQQHLQQQQQYRAACCGSSAGSSSNRLMASPTSTLVGLAQSPPPLSPPLSPSHSPPMSPSSCIQRRQRIQQQQQQHHGFSAPSSPHMQHGSKTMSELVTALQQLELQKAAAVALNNSWAAAQQYSHSPLRPSGIPSSCGVQQRGMSMSVPVTPTKARWGETMWEMDLGEEDISILQQEEEMAAAASLVVPRVESGRDLRAKIYGRLAGRGVNVLDHGFGASSGSYADRFGANGIGDGISPDLNWVNDLVTE